MSPVAEQPILREAPVSVLRFVWGKKLVIGGCWFSRAVFEAKTDLRQRTRRGIFHSVAYLADPSGNPLEHTLAFRLAIRINTRWHSVWQRQPKPKR
eukprot:365070-Chlamydomonas_euryale.AAC.6